MPVRNLVVIALTAIVSLVCYQTALRNRYAATFVEALELVEHEALEPYSGRELFNAAMNGMLRQIDEHSAFIDPEAYPAFKENLDQEFAGIGITASIDPNTGRLMVLSPTVGTPAYRAGVHAGDLILEVNGESTEGLSLDDAVKRLRGKPGSQVTVSLGRAGEDEPLEVTLTRQIILIDSVLGDTRNADGSWNFYLENQPHIGYVRLNTFGERSTEELRDTLQEVVTRSDALILDLRDNAGGLLDAAIEIADFFLDDGQAIVSTRGRDGKVREEYFARNDRTLVPARMPVVVLVNRYSASASEILAACLQDHGRAVVVGERSWGKGTVQNVIELENGRSVMKLTTASYWRPSGVNIHRKRKMTEEDPWGVRPTDGMEIALTDDQFRELIVARRDRDYPGAFRETLSVDSPQVEGADGEATPDDNGSSSEPVGSFGGPTDSPSLAADEPLDSAADLPADAATRGPSSTGGTGDGNAAPTPESDGEFFDPHVERAVEYLQQRLAGGVAEQTSRVLTARILTVRILTARIFTAAIF